jgi:hypothetical protein
MIEFLERLRNVRVMFAYTDRDKQIKQLANEIHSYIAGSVVWAYRYEIGDEHYYADRLENIPANADADSIIALYRHPKQDDAKRLELIKRIDSLPNPSFTNLMAVGLVHDLRKYLQGGA